jgi:hypothetical protein
LAGVGAADRLTANVIIDNLDVAAGKEGIPAEGRRFQEVDDFLSWVAGLGLASVLARLVVGITKIVIVKMAIKGVPAGNVPRC